MNIRVHIERVVLEGSGMTADQAYYLETALVAELSRLLAAEHIGASAPSRIMRPEILVGAALKLSDRPGRMATQLAAVVNGALRTACAAHTARHAAARRWSLPRARGQLVDRVARLSGTDVARARKGAKP